MQFSMSPSNSPQNSPPASPPRQSQQMRQSMLKDLPSDPNLITPAIRATLPAFQLVQDRQRTPEPESRLSTSSSEVEIPETEFILKPHTYTPLPSPRPPSNPRQPSPPPELSKKSSHRKRFSLKRNAAP